MKKITLLLICLCLCLVLVSCDEVIGGDDTSDNPQYVQVNGETLYFTLELRMPSDSTTREEGDAYSHSALDGDKIFSWQVPYYGNTVYESIKKFFEDRDDNITFKLSGSRFYMFDACTLENGDVYKLQNAYISADGKYAQVANRQTLLGEDNIAGTVDDLKVLVIVYMGWLS